MKASFVKAVQHWLRLEHLTAIQNEDKSVMTQELENIYVHFYSSYQLPL